MREMTLVEKKVVKLQIGYAPENVERFGKVTVRVDHWGNAKEVEFKGNGAVVAAGGDHIGGRFGRTWSAAYAYGDLAEFGKVEGGILTLEDGRQFRLVATDSHVCKHN